MGGHSGLRGLSALPRQFVSSRVEAGEQGFNHLFRAGAGAVGLSWQKVPGLPRQGLRKCGCRRLLGLGLREHDLLSGCGNTLRIGLPRLPGLREQHVHECLHFESF